MRPFIQQASRWGFHQLYHGLAWAYDTVAALVSLGQWYDWTRAVQPFVLGPRVLEVGQGTGHLLETLATAEGLRPFGLDESEQMLRLARRRNLQRIPLIRGMVQNLPAASTSFDTIVATFPTDFIRDVRAIRELYRVLQPGGRLVILPMAQFIGSGTVERFMAWALAIVGEAPRDWRGAIATMILPSLERAGFRTDLHEFRSSSSAVIVIVSTKSDRRA